MKAVGAEERDHEPAQDKADETKAAAGGGANEVEGKAKEKQVNAMAGAKPGKFNRDAFKEAVRKKIQGIQVNSLSDVKNIKDGDQAQGISNAVKGEVAAGKESTAAAVTATAQQAPDPSGIQPTKGAELPAAKAGDAKQVDATKAVPPPVPDQRVSMDAESQSIDQQMADAKLTKTQLVNANEPEFQAAASAKDNAQEQAKALPASARAGEQTVLAKAQGDVSTVTQAGLAGMHGRRADLLGGARDLQSGGKDKHEAARTRLTAQFEAIYTKTKTDVDTRLAKLDTEVNTAFDDGASSAKRSFYLFLAKELLAYVAVGFVFDLFSKDNKYQKIFEEGRKKYAADMETVIGNVATVVETGLNEVVGIIARGKQELDLAVTKLPDDEKDVGRELATGLQAKFADLEKSVEEKQTQIVDSLAQKYVQASKEVDDLVNTLKDPVGAAINYAKETISGVIETINKMRLLLMGVLAKAQEAIGLIIDNPIGFLGNLVAGVKLGFMNFVGKIGTYLKKGLLDWLFGALAEAGIQMPVTFDLKGIFSLVMQVLGLTYANIRARAVKIVGEPLVSKLELVAGVFKRIVTEGPIALWEEIKEKLGDLNALVIEPIKAFVIEKVITAGVTWVVSLLNPASAFVKACKTIYDIVMFFVERGKQVLDLVNAVLDSVVSIAKGAIGVAASFVEAALAKALPVVISFLASLLGLGGISSRIKGIVAAIQKPVNKALDWVINKAVSLVKGVASKLGIGKKDEDELKSADPQHDAKVNKGLSELDQLDAKEMKGGGISREAADQHAQRVKSDNSVFKSITVLEGESTWDYIFVASSPKKHKGANKATSTGGVVQAGIYEFPDQKPTKPGIPPGTIYIGQSGDIPTRLKKHESKGRLLRGTEKTKAVPGTKLDREIEEHKRIQKETGGQKAKQSTKVSNKVDPVGATRRGKLGLPEPSD